MSCLSQGFGRFVGFSAPRVSASSELTWAIWRLLVVAGVTVGTILFLRDTDAYFPTLAALGFVFVYDGLFLLLLKRNHVWPVFFVGLVLDSLVTLVTWWLIVRSLAGSLHTNDLWLILFPITVTGITRLGWLIGSLYSALWLGWLTWTALSYFPANSYDVTQLPVRVAFIAINAGLVLRIVAQLDQEREGERTRTRQMEELQELKSRLLLTVSHELRSPATAIRAAGDLLADRSVQLSNEQRARAIKALTNGVARLDSLVQEASNYAQMQDPNLTMDRRLVHFQEVLQRAVELAAPLIEAKGQRLETDTNPLLPALFVDPIGMERALFNLLNNASKFTPPGGTISIKAKREGQELVAEVRDSGPGVPQGYEQLIFTEFYRGGRSDSPGEEGLGLGLAIARRVFELHGGSVEALSSSGQGAVFVIRLPIPGTRPSSSGG